MSFRNNKQFRLTKTGKVIKSQTENYLRDDIYCGSAACEKCPENPSLNPSATTDESDASSRSTRYSLPEGPRAVYLLPTADVLLQQPDWLTNRHISNVILLQSVLQHVREQAPFLYHQAREVAEESDKHCYVFSDLHHRQCYVEPNESETQTAWLDRAAVSACQWYTNHLRDLGVGVTLLVTERTKQKEFQKLGVHCQTVHQYVKSLGIAELEDSLVGSDKVVDEEKDDADLAEAGLTAYFPKYFPESELKRMKHSGELFEGPLRQNRDNFLEAVVSSDTMGEDILILGSMSRNRAMANDMVYAQLLPKSQWRPRAGVYLDLDVPLEEMTIRDMVEKKELDNDAIVTEEEEKNLVPTGIVVGVAKRSSFRRYCGSVEIGSDGVENGEQYILVDTIDLQMPKVKIFTQRIKELAGQRVVIQVDAWPRYSKYPIGHCCRILGPIGDQKVESEAILIQHGISYEAFTPAVMKCLPPSPWTITDHDRLVRRDLRDLRICSIDPPGCTDIDDALHVKILENGNYEVGVHIADVTHFVLEGSALDLEARKRGNSIYLVERRIDMLPTMLSTDICSLKPFVERFAFSCVWELTPNAEIVSVEFFKSIIKSVCAHTYQQAQEKIDCVEDNSPLTQELRVLNKLAKVLRKRRIDAGALELSSPDIKFVRQKDGEDPVDVELYQLRDTNSLVEEFMLLANVSVAEQIVKFFPAFSLLRRHPPPKAKQFQVLIELIAKHGFKFNIENSKALSKSLNDCQKDGDPYFNELVRILSTRCLTPAVYFASGTVNRSDFHHYGLAAPIYTHFTSPIRRYADVVVHRLLAATIGAATLPNQLTQKNVRQTCNNINRRHRMAEIASRDSTRIHTLNFLANKGKLIETARIISLKQNGLHVLIPRLGLEGKVYLCSGLDSSELWHYNAKEQSVTSLNGARTYRIFDVIQVEVSLDKTRAHSRKVVLRIVGEENEVTGDGGLKKLAASKQKKISKNILNTNDAVVTNSSAKKGQKIANTNTSKPQVDSEEERMEVIGAKKKNNSKKSKKKSPNKQGKNTNTAEADESPNRKRRNSEPLPQSPGTQKKRKEGK